MINVFHGDCFNVMKGFSDNSVDSIVTDPPYGLSFMGKHWDYDVPGVEVWKECLRVLKPGGHLLSFGGSRTYHRMAVNIEDAGFEIRDQIMWVYGSGFPKSLNVGKAVDKMMGNEREEIGLSRRHNSGEFGGEKYGNFKGGIPIKTKGTSEFEGWGTALKPAHEPIVLARKPISEKSIAENCLKWGTGGLNIDGCRVAGEAWTRSTESIQDIRGNAYNQAGDKRLYRSPQEMPKGGRFPANFIHDGSQLVLDLFPESKSVGHFNSKVKMKGHTLYEGGFNDFEQDDRTLNDSGSAARFFYCAKASKADRDEGLEEFESKSGSEITGRKEGSSGLVMEGGKQNPFACKASPINRNYHPTVKPTALMQYLCRLVTPKNGTVLDPFMGSGSTGKAAVREGFSFIGIEREAEYVEIAKKRIV